MRRRVARRSRVKMSEYHPLFKASGLCFEWAPPILTKKCRHNAKNLKRNSKNLQFLFCGATNQKFFVFLDGDWRYTQEKKRSYFVLFFFSYLIVMMPKDVLWRFGTELDDTSEIDVTAHVDVELGTAQNHRLGSWKRSEDLIFFTTTHNLVFFTVYPILWREKSNFRAIHS